MQRICWKYDGNKSIQNVYNDIKLISSQVKPSQVKSGLVNSSNLDAAAFLLHLVTHIHTHEKNFGVEQMRAHTLSHGIHI